MGKGKFAMYMQWNIIHPLLRTKFCRMREIDGTIHEPDKEREKFPVYVELL